MEFPAVLGAFLILGCQKATMGLSKGHTVSPRRGAEGGKPQKVPRSAFLEAKGPSKKVAFPFCSRRKGTF